MKTPICILAAVAAVAIGWKIPSPGPVSASAAASGIESTWGLDVINPIVGDKANISVPITDWRLQGFENALVGNHRTAHVIRTGPNAVIRASVPAAGTFYPAFILYDMQGAERVAVSVDGVEAGTAAADWDNNRERLFFLTAPRTFKGGEEIELRSLDTEGNYRFESLMLLKNKPAARPFSYVFREVGAQAEESEARISWISSWPAACTVEWAPAAGGASATVVEIVAVNNHRVILRDLAQRSSYRYRIMAVSRDGSPVATAWQTFTTSPRASVTGTVRSRRVPLTVREEAAVPLNDEAPVTSGLPFPKGELGSDAHVRLLDAGGKEHPLQTRTLARWPDGSAKWVLLDFQTDARKAGPLTLEYGTAVTRREPKSALNVTETADAVALVTGPGKFVVAKRRFGFPESCAIDLNRDGRFDESEQIVSPGRPGAFRLTDLDGTEYITSDAPEEVVVEERGPLRAVVRIEGGHRSSDGRKLFSYVLRVHAYAGKPYFRVQHTFVNDSLASDFTSIRSLGFRLPLAKRGGASAEWAAGEADGAFRSADRIHLRQHTDNRYVIDGAAPGRTGERAPGWAQWSDGARTVTLAVRDFWQNYPKDLIADGDGLEFGICPPLSPDEYAAAKGSMDDHRLYYYLQNGAYKFRQGLSKTHDIWLDFQPSAQPDAAGAEPSVVRARRAPLLAVALPRWYSDSKTFGGISPAVNNGVGALYEVAFDRSFQGYLRNRATNREYGMLNFGDWWGERVINWGNSEYDTQYGFFLQFARTGDLKYFRVAEEAALHNRDVDTAHANRIPSRIGGVYIHAVGHTGDYYQESPLPPRGIVRGGFQVSHTFVEGHLYHYFLTGDTRSFETAIKIADRDDTYTSRNFDFSDSRNAGWHLILTMAAYDATGDAFYLNAAKIIVERVLERQTPDGGWSKLLTPGHCACLPRHYGNAGFMLAVLLTGLRMYEETTGDARIPPAVIGGARFLIDDTWVSEARAFRYTSCPKTSIMAGLNFLSFDAIVYAHRRTGDSKMKTVLIQGTDTALQAMAGMGKGFTQTTRVAPHFLAYLDNIRETPAPAGAR